jgi:hypothetical protein
MTTPRLVWYCWGCRAERPGWDSKIRCGCSEATVTLTPRTAGPEPRPVRSGGDQMSYDSLLELDVIS